MFCKRDTARFCVPFCFSFLLLTFYSSSKQSPHNDLIHICCWPPEEPSYMEHHSFCFIYSDVAVLIMTTVTLRKKKNLNLKLQWQFKECLHYEFLTMVVILLWVRRLVLLPFIFLFLLLLHFKGSLNILQEQLTFDCHWMNALDRSWIASVHICLSV